MSRPRRCRWWGLVLAVLGCSQLSANGCCSLAQPTPKVRVPTATPKNPERFAFELRDADWTGEGGVLAWLSDKTGLPVITSLKPAGRFTFEPPRGANAPRYTIPEIIDILNETLEKQNLI